MDDKNAFDINELVKELSDKIKKINEIAHCNPLIPSKIYYILSDITEILRTTIDEIFTTFPTIELNLQNPEFTKDLYDFVCSINLEYQLPKEDLELFGEVYAKFIKSPDNLLKMAIEKPYLRIIYFNDDFYDDTDGKITEKIIKKYNKEVMLNEKQTC